MQINTIYDVEVSPTKSMVGFKDLNTGKISQFKSSEGKSIGKYIKNRILIGFNSLNYDDIILTAMLQGKSAKAIYKISVDLIEGDGKRWDYPSDIKNGIDIMEVAEGTASLKLYAARLNAKKLQDLPYDPHEKHTKKMWAEVWKYNKNDLEITQLLYDFLKPQLQLREDLGKQYGINVMSRSDAQVAEDIFRVELKKANIDVKSASKGKSKVKSIQYSPPESVKFKSQKLKTLVEKIEKTSIEIGANGSPMMPGWLKETVISIGSSAYNIGLGGLHSMEKSTAVIPKKGYKLGNVDVASMYPSLIISMGLYPKHLGSGFLDIYTKIRDTRIAAKRSGNKVVSDTLKIVLNGSYGKFGSNYSFLYSPDLMLQVTFTGQLFLLMLIEAFEDAGIEVVSSNTDGIEFIYDDLKQVQKIVSKWEKRTKMEMEYGEYKALYSRDVNAYIAVYDGYVKAKGFYGEPKLSKNREYPIVSEAIRKFLGDGISMEKTIRKCKDPAMFCVSRQVTGGALWSPEKYPNTEEYDNYIAKKLKKNKALETRNDNYQKEFILAEAGKWYIGKVVRFYFAKNGKPMFYKKSGNRVPKSDGCKPMMQLKKKVPKDLDYDKYIALAQQHLEELGYEYYY